MAGTEDYYSKELHSKSCGQALRDFWESNATYEGPATDASFFGPPGDDVSYSAAVYGRRATAILRRHAPSRPLFLYVAAQNAHEPDQTPQRFYDLYADDAGASDCAWDPAQSARGRVELSLIHI